MGGRPPGKCRRRGYRTARSPTASRTVETTRGCVMTSTSSSHPHPRAADRIGRPLRLVVAPVVGGGSGLPLLRLPTLLALTLIGRLAGQRGQLVAHDVAQRRRRHAAREALRV